MLEKIVKIINKGNVGYKKIYARKMEMIKYRRRNNRFIRKYR